MTSQTGQQIIIIHMLFNSSRSQVEQPMKFGQLIKCSVRNIFLQKSSRNWFSKKPLYEVKASGQYLSFNIFS